MKGMRVMSKKRESRLQCKGKRVSSSQKAEVGLVVMRNRIVMMMTLSEMLLPDNSVVRVRSLLKTTLMVKFNLMTMKLSQEIEMLLYSHKDQSKSIILLRKTIES